MRGRESRRSPEHSNRRDASEPTLPTGIRRTPGRSPDVLQTGVASERLGPTVTRRAVRRAALVGAAAAAFCTVSIAVAGFGSSATGSPMAVTSKKIFPGVRSTSAWNLKDASAGAGEVDASDVFRASGDSLVKTTGNWSSAFASTRYVEFDFNGSAAAGVPVSTATLNFSFADNVAGNTACIYLEVYRASTSTLLGSYGSSGSPLACSSSSTTYTNVNQSIATQVTSTDALNDLRIRVYGRESGNRAMKIDLATVSGATSYGNYTVYEQISRDASTGTATTTNWALAISGDGTNYQSASNWTNAFSTSRYLKFTFDPGVPAGAVIASVTLNFYYRASGNGDTACWYGEAYNGVTLLASYGSSGTPQSCNTGNTTYSTDTVTMSQLTSANDANAVTDVNALAVRAYMRESAAKKTQIDFAQLNVNYYLN